MALRKSFKSLRADARHQNAAITATRLGSVWGKSTGICREGRAWAQSVKITGKRSWDRFPHRPVENMDSPRRNAPLTWVKVRAKAGHLSSSQHSDMGHQRNNTLSGILAWASSRLSSSLSSLLRTERLQPQNGCPMLRRGIHNRFLRLVLQTIINKLVTAFPR